MPDLMPDLYEQLAEFRGRLLRAGLWQSLSAAYGKVYQRLRAQLDALTRQILVAQERGEIVDQLWLLRQERYRALLNQVAGELGRFAQQAGKQITKQQQTVVNQALRDSAALVQTAASEAGIGVGFNRLPKAAVQNLVGVLSDGSPLASLLNEIPLQGRKKVEDALVEGVVLGHSPKQIARQFRDALGGGLDRALRIARTSVVQSYREASRQNYQANEHVVRGWRWVASLSTRTCASCAAMHGTEHPLTERLNDHVNGRCVMVPLLRDVPAQPLQSGDEWLRQQSVETQINVLGSRAAQAAYARGEVRLEQFVGQREDPRWGTMRYRLSLREALMNDQPLAKGTSLARGWFFAAQETFPYTPAGVVYGQRTPDSCVAACARMLLHDAGLQIPEIHLRELLRVSRRGAYLSDLPATLRTAGLKQQAVYQARLPLAKLQDSLQRGPVAVFVARGGFAHVLLLDGLDADFASLRDPLPEGEGRAYKVKLQDFLAVWARGKKGTGAAVIMVD